MLPAILIGLLFAADGVSLYRAREFPAAERELRKALKSNPKDDTARLYLVRTLMELGRIPEALVELEGALAGPANPETQFQAGAILRELAERRFNDLERVAPESAAVHQLAGRQLERQGKLEEALREYQAALRKEPGRPGLHYEAGNVLWRMRELDAATRELEAELARTPHHGMASLRLGQVLAAQGQDARAVNHLERAAQAMSKSAEARRELGKAYRKTGRLQECRREWEAVAKLRPGDDQIHFLLGNLYRDLGDAAPAQRELATHRRILEKRRALSENR